MSKLPFAAAALAAIALLTGCSRPTDIHDNKIVSDGPALTSVTLTICPPAGAVETLDMQEMVGSASDNHLNITSEKVTTTITASTPDWYAVSIKYSDYHLIRNDQAVDEDTKKRALESMSPYYEISKRGNYISGRFYALPVSYNFPERPLQVGDTWEGFLALGSRKEKIEFQLDSILHAKGHDLAVVTYQYPGLKGEEPAYTDWIDAQSGLILKKESKLHHNDVTDLTVMSDPIYEH